LRNEEGNTGEIRIANYCDHWLTSPEEDGAQTKTGNHLGLVDPDPRQLREKKKEREDFGASSRKKIKKRQFARPRLRGRKW